MKSRLQKIKWRRIAWLAASVVLMYVCVAASYRFDAQYVSAVSIILNKDADVFFLNEQNIQSYLDELSITSGETKLNDIDLAQLERMIESNGYVRDAEVYIDALAGLHVSVEQRVPVLRIMNNNGVSYYVDSLGNKMPLHPKFTPRVIVACGLISANDQITDTAGQKQLLDLVCLTNNILGDDFNARMIQQIWVDEVHNIHLVPMVAQQDILFGNEQQMEAKLSNLKRFYLNADAGKINTYSKLNLTFNNQVIATKRTITKPASITPPNTTP